MVSVLTLGSQMVALAVLLVPSGHVLNLRFHFGLLLFGMGPREVPSQASQPMAQPFENLQFEKR